MAKCSAKKTAANPIPPSDNKIELDQEVFDNATLLLSEIKAITDALVECTNQGVSMQDDTLQTLCVIANKKAIAAHDKLLGDHHG